MHKLHELKEKLLEELEEYAESGKVSRESVVDVKNLASSIDHICNILEYKDEMEDGYSERGMSYDRDRRGYWDGMSYARGRGRNARRDSMGRYSREGGVEDTVEYIHSVMHKLPQEVQRDAQRFVEKLEQHV